jgi:SAM-dependent methyltransferase
VITSHVLEHVANPVAALAEWYRVLRPGGIIYLVVPDRRRTWDHSRPLTPVTHLLEDFERGTTAADATHIDEFALGIDWTQFSPATPQPDVATTRATLARGMHEAVARGEQINIHFHTFEEGNVLALLETLRTWPKTRFNWEVLDHASDFPTSNPIGFLAVVRVNKSWSDRLEGWRNARRTKRNPKYPVSPDAQPFEEFARTCQGIGGVKPNGAH